MVKMGIFGVMMMVACSAFTQTRVPADVANMQETLRAALTRQAATNQFLMTTVANDYVSDLKKLYHKEKAAKDAAAQATVKAEVERFVAALKSEPDEFEAVPELPEAVQQKALPALRVIQGRYLEQRSIIEKMGAERVVDLAQKYVVALDLVQKRLSDSGKAVDAAAAKKEATRMRVLLQRKDAASALFKQYTVKNSLMPPAPDLAGFETEEAAQSVANITASTLITSLPISVQQALTKPMEAFDKDWPPEITKWTFDASGNYAHDFSLYRVPGVPDELGIFVYAKTMRAYVRGTKKSSTVQVNGQAMTWLGKGMSWNLKDSRDLVFKAIYTTQHPALSAEAGPAACVAIYSSSEKDKVLGAMSVPMTKEITELKVTKHYSYNRVNISWEGEKRRRGFTIPNNMPIRIVVGVVAFNPGEEVDALMEIRACPQVEQ